MIDEKRLYQVLGERLREARETHSGSRGWLTQADLAKQVGLKRTSITNIEKGVQKVPLHVLLCLCEVLRIQVKDLLPSIDEVRLEANAMSREDVAGSEGVVTRPMANQVINMILKNIPSPSHATSHS